MANTTLVNIARFSVIALLAGWASVATVAAQGTTIKSGSEGGSIGGTFDVPPPVKAEPPPRASVKQVQRPVARPEPPPRNRVVVRPAVAPERRRVAEPRRVRPEEPEVASESAKPCDWVCQTQTRMSWGSSR